MFVDANSLDPGARIEAEVCIVGAGAAGIALARTLARHGIGAVLLESGGMTQDADTQKLYDLVNPHPQYPFSMARIRFFGGSTNAWGGWCRPLDEEDFLPHSWVSESGWPIRRADLDPYYPEAMSILDIPPRMHAVPIEQLAEDTEHQPYLLGRDNADFEPLVWLQSAPTRMNQKYRGEIGDSSQIRCLLHANVTELVVDEGGSRVTSVKVRTLAGRTFTVVAKVYALCAGGLENARLLLLSDSVVKGGIGNRHELVGRYLMEHVSVPPPWLAMLPPGGTGRFQEEALCERSRAGRLPGVKSDMFGFATRFSLRREHQLLACSINVLGAPETNPDSAPQAIRDLLATPGTTSTPGAAAQPLRVYGMFVLAEQAPNRDSRVSLGTELDALGQRKLVLDLKFTDQDQRSVRTSLDFFARALGALGRGRVGLRELDPAFCGGQAFCSGGGHDMGTTRMADDPQHGVTDRYGRVHDIENLFVAGSSLFPTGGFANPTLTIVALTLRLADRLKDVVRTASTPSTG